MLSTHNEVFAVGPLVMLRVVCELTRPYGIPHGCQYELHYD